MDGSRLYLFTMVTSKYLLQIYDKAMSYYPLFTLMLGGIKDILIISTPNNAPRFEYLQFSVSLSYCVQEGPKDLTEVFIWGEGSCEMTLRDNVFYGNLFFEMLKNGIKTAKNGCATVFEYYVNSPKSFGIVEFGENGKGIYIEEK